MKKLRNNLDIYNQRASEWWKEEGAFSLLKQFNPARFQYFDRFISDWQGLRVLDVGCGGGYSSEFMAKRGAHVSGIDVSNKSIEAAKKHSVQEHLSIHYQQGVAENLPFRNEWFDVVLCADVLEHVTDLAQVISEIHRVLKPRGFFFFDTINRTFLSKIVLIWILEGWLKIVPAGTHDWRKFIKPKELKELLKRAGFEHIEIEGFNVIGRTKGGRGGDQSMKVLINRFQLIMYIGSSQRMS